MLVPDINGLMQYVNISIFINAIDDSFDADKDVAFLLYTRSNPTNGQRLYRNTSSFASSYFNSSLQTRFMIHGWLNDFSFPVNTEIRDAYLKNGDFNYVGDSSKKKQLNQENLLTDFHRLECRIRNCFVPPSQIQNSESRSSSSNLHKFHDPKQFHDA